MCSDVHDDEPVDCRAARDGPEDDDDDDDDDAPTARAQRARREV